MAPEFVSFLNIVILAALAVAAPFVARFGVQLLRSLRDKAKAAASAEQWAQLEAVAGLLVMAAEQSGFAGKIKADGKTKHDQVLAQLEKYAADHGFGGLDFHAFDALVEGKVYEVINAPEAGNAIL